MKKSITIDDAGIVDTKPMQTPPNVGKKGRLKNTVRLIQAKPGYFIEIDENDVCMTSMAITKEELVSLYLLIKDEVIRVSNIEVEKFNQRKV